MQNNASADYKEAGIYYVINYFLKAYNLLINIALLLYHDLMIWFVNL